MSSTVWVPPHAPAALETALLDLLLDLLLDPQRARRLGSAGRKRFESHFSRDRMVKGTIEVYRAALAAKKGRVKVLLISHICQSRSEGQPKALELARLGIELQVVVPRRWKHYGEWRAPEKPDADAPFQLLPLTARWPWCGPAQSYLHWYPRLGRLLRAWQPDVIDLWEEPWSLVSAHTCFLRDRLCPQCRL